jgi:hypothetical protein
MKLKNEMVAILWLLASSLASAAQEKPKWITEGPYVEEDSFSFELPLEVLATKIYIEVEVGGVPRRFVFDTGSPSMMSADLAAELELKVIEKRRGRDSHGAIVETGIVQSDLTLGGTTFRKVPIFVADFPKTAQCLFDGVLGSDVLSLCAWQIDLPGSALRCNSELTKLGHVEKAKRQHLYDSGYPYAPILDIRLAEQAKSKALFDTGSPEYLAISPPDFEGAKRNGGVVKTISGVGSMGGSMGGRAPNKDQLLVQMKTLAIGNIQLGRVGALLRESPPSLIGASILEHFVATLDSITSTAYFDQYRGGPFSRSSYGFGLSFDEAVRVSLVWDGSPAETAGLHVGQRVTSINGQPTSTSCDGIRSAMRAISGGDTIDLGLDGGATTLTRENVFPN